MVVETALLIGSLVSATNKSIKMDEASVQKNSRAFTRMADSEYKVEQSQKRLLEKIQINCVRKKAILNYHVEKASDILKKYEVILIQKRGRGIAEMEELTTCQNKIATLNSTQTLASVDMMKDSQLAINFALRGITGLMVQESKMKQAAASQNMSRANAVKAQADTVIMSLDAIGERVEMTTKLLERLGMLLLQFIKYLNDLFDKNGYDVEKYTDHDCEMIDLTADCTIVVYHIINAPILDENSQISHESNKVIAEGNEKLQKLNCFG